MTGNEMITALREEQGFLVVGSLNDSTYPSEDGIDTLAPCNECGVLVLVGDLLCGECCEEESREKEWEAMHPELRCPPRE